MLNFLKNDNIFFWLINGKIISRLNSNSNLQDLADFLFNKLDIERSDYGPIQFLLNEAIYEEFELGLVDIGILPEYLIVVDFTTFPTFPMRPMTLKDRDRNIEYKDGIKFQLFLVNKLKYMVKSYLAKTRKHGTFYLAMPEFLLTRTDHPMEIHIIQQKITEIENLTQSYLAGIVKIMKALFIL